MTRHFGLSRRTTLDDRSPGSQRGTYSTRADLNSLRPTVDLLHPRGNGVQTLLDIAALIFWVALGSLSGLAVAVAIYILLFVRM